MAEIVITIRKYLNGVAVVAAKAMNGENNARHNWMGRKGKWGREERVDFSPLFPFSQPGEKHRLVHSYKRFSEVSLWREKKKTDYKEIMTMDKFFVVI